MVWMEGILTADNPLKALEPAKEIEPPAYGLRNLFQPFRHVVGREMENPAPVSVRPFATCAGIA